MTTRLNWPIIPPSVLTGVVEIGQREGINVGLWFSETGLDAAQILTAASEKISYRQTMTVLRRAIRAMPGAPLGMQVGGRDTLLSMGMLGVAMRSCATAGEALSVGLDLHLAAGSLTDLELETFDDEMALRFYERWPDHEIISFLCEEALCSVVIFARSVIGADWSPSRVELSYPPPSYAGEYRRFLHCPVDFSAHANRIFFPAAALAQPLSTHNETTRALAVDACQRLLGLGRSDPNIVLAVETVLDRDLRRPLSMADVAVLLHVSERTLRRQLAAADESFSAVRDRVRQRRATFLLRESALPIGTIAREVGYSDIREFRRAYVRWAGHPPSAERRLSM